MFGFSGSVWQRGQKTNKRALDSSSLLEFTCSSFLACQKTAAKIALPLPTCLRYRLLHRERNGGEGKKKEKKNPGGVGSYLIGSVFREGKPLQRAEVCLARLCLHTPRHWSHTHARTHTLTHTLDGPWQHLRHHTLKVWLVLTWLCIQSLIQLLIAGIDFALWIEGWELG